jgi:two-component system, OmpR family, phosphate regulon sensor histidine kinase PhoR
MKNFRWLAALMIIAILGITGFQVYWLKQNYAREEKTLTIKAEMTFRETIMQLQVAKLKLDGAEWSSETTSAKGKDSSRSKLKIIMHEKEGEQVRLRFKPNKEVVSTINVVRARLIDSMKSNPAIKPGAVAITMNTTSAAFSKDSMDFDRHLTRPAGPGTQFYSLLYGVDSLQDSLRLPEIDSAYAKALQEEKLDIPFSILKKDSLDVTDEPVFNEVTVGLVKPITYKLQLGNTFPYLLKQITQPILFSVLLLGITLLSFILLYRSLLKQRRLSALKNEFISNITHELKTPIATVGVAIEALKNFNAIDNPQRTKEYLDISQNELQRLSLLVDKVLKLSMFEKKEMELKKEPVDLLSVVNEVADSLKLQFEKNKAVLTVTGQQGVTLQGDRLHLLSVVFNLLDNALKYGKENLAVVASVVATDKEVVLTVTDNGIGIPAEYKDKVFEKFFRVPHGDTHNAKGYGLGLSYVAQVVEKHNGTIEIKSDPGKGSTFIITLPKQNV